MDNIKIPKHVAIIMDGNGRWAKSKGKNRSYGHKKGFENLVELSRYIFDKDIHYLSVFAFSTENFKRSKEEVDYLMNLFLKGFKVFEKELHKKGIKIIFSGREKPLNDAVIKEMKRIEKNTLNNNSGVLNICLNYGGHAELVDTTKKICEKVMNKELKLEDLTEEKFSENLYNDLPEIDFLIRTSGEQRLSNFMLWQIAYAEFYFPKVHFPDFNKEEFDKALVEYTKRDRRFGAIKDYDKD